MPQTHAFPDFLSHYYEASIGPFQNLSDLPLVTAEKVLDQIRLAGLTFASQRSKEYLEIRQGLEDCVRQAFLDKGGRPQRTRPHYMVLGSCPWLVHWYRDGRELRIPLAYFEPQQISFTYGDTFPAMRYQDGKATRGQVYRLDELPGIIQEYGLPQEWNPDGKLGPERYIEAQIWDDEPLLPFLSRMVRFPTGNPVG